MALVGLMWIIGCVILSWSALYESIDPTYSLTQVSLGFLLEVSAIFNLWFYAVLIQLDMIPWTCTVYVANLKV